jgi:magnesium-transporting ATPase (P-type)
MSLRDKAREVKEAGVAERGNFTPDGVPLRVYKWWLEQSKSKRASAIRNGTRKENFCHFWRVVLVWAPLRKLWHGVLNIAPWLALAVGLTALGIFIYALVTVPSVLTFVLQVLLATLITACLIAGFPAGATLAMSPERRKRNDMLPMKFAVPLAVVGLPTATVAFVITKVVCLYRDHLRAYDKQVALGTAVAVLAAAATLIGIGAGWLTLLVVSGTILALACTVFGLIILGMVFSDYISGKRAMTKLRISDAREKFYDEHGHWPEDETREPSLVSKFFSGIGDFIILLAQVVRVNKWKICPIVEVDTK